MTPIVPRVGCVPYLNARPLLEGLPFPVRKLVPAQLYDVFCAGELDVALLSSIDVISKAQSEVVDGVSISSRGDVFSVVLSYEGELKDITKVALDPASHTSNALLRIVLEEFHGIVPEYIQLTDIGNNFIPSLMIGDRAIQERIRTSNASVRYLDLGGEWFRNTGMPFVFALWKLRNEFTNKSSLSDEIRESKRRGIAVIPKIALLEEDPAFAEGYLLNHIRYDLGDEEKRGLALFGDYLQKLNIANNNINRLIYY
ncbi:MAG: Chorismate dehydratase [Verrucomicrobiota bacterium]|jgi:predicted solute-binding protein